MIILDDSYVSSRMQRYLELSRQPVLETEMSRSLRAKGADISLVPEDQAIERIDAGEPLYAMSESHFDWVMEHVSRENIRHSLSIFKDKERMREVLAPLFPNYTFRALDVESLLDMPFPEQEAPFVLKPSVGFLSLGIYVVRTEADWACAQGSIRASRGDWGQWYNASVIGTERFIMESLIEGTEYALDAYYDENGTPHLLNILRHDFAGPKDTSDRLYVCGARIMQEKRAAMIDFLAKANDLCHVRSFPVHVEVRECNGQIIPIEFNALRFAGLGGTEVSHMAFGFYTFAHYLQNTEPDWDAAFEHAGDALYCMSVLNPPAATPAGTTMDYDAFCAQFSHVIAMDRFDFDASGIMGFMFWKTSAEVDAERVRMLNDDLSAFLIHPESSGAAGSDGANGLGCAAETGCANGPDCTTKPPTEYSPNRRHPDAARKYAGKSAQDADSADKPEGARAPREPIAPGAPIPPAGFNEQNPFDNESNPFGKGVNPFDPRSYSQGQPQGSGQGGEPGKDFVPSTAQKAAWSLAGFLLGLIGVGLVFIMALGRPKTVRTEMLKWAGIGFAAVMVMELCYAFLMGGSIASMTGGLGGPAGSISANPSSSGGIF